MLSKAIVGSVSYTGARSGHAARKVAAAKRVTRKVAPKSFVRAYATEPKEVREFLCTGTKDDEQNGGSALANKSVAVSPQLRAEGCWNGTQWVLSLCLSGNSGRHAGSEA